MTTVRPSHRWTVSSTSARSTYAGRYTPYGDPRPGGAVSVNPGYDASASSTAAALNGLPTTSAEGSFTTTRSRQDAASSVSASAAGREPSDQSMLAGGLAA